MKDPAFLAALRQRQVRVHFFVDIELDTGTVRMWDGYGNSPSLDGNTYVGVGDFGSIDFGDDKLSTMARPFTISLAGAIDDRIIGGFTEAVGEALDTTALQNRVITVTSALTDQNATAVLYKTVNFTKGRIDTVSSIEDEDKNMSLSITIEDKTILRKQRNARHYSQPTHEEDNPGSTFLAKAALLRKQRLIVGRPG